MPCSEEEKKEDSCKPTHEKSGKCTYEQAVEMWQSMEASSDYKPEEKEDMNEPPKEVNPEQQVKSFVADVKKADQPPATANEDEFPPDSKIKKDVVKANRSLRGWTETAGGPGSGQKGHKTAGDPPSGTSRSPTPMQEKLAKQKKKMDEQRRRMAQEQRDMERDQPLNMPEIRKSIDRIKASDAKLAAKIEQDIKSGKVKLNDEGKLVVMSEAGTATEMSVEEYSRRY